MDAVRGRISDLEIRHKFREYLGRFLQLVALFEQRQFGTTKLARLCPNPYIDNGGDTNRIAMFRFGPYFSKESMLKRELLFYSSKIDSFRNTITYQLYSDVRQSGIIDT
jgi:hypothetical protein